MGTIPGGKPPGCGSRSKRRFSTTRRRRPSGRSRLKRRNHGCWRASGVSTFSRIPVLLPFSGPRNEAAAAPDQRHITPKVWQTPSRAASSLARIASKSLEAGPLERLQEVTARVEHGVDQRVVAQVGPAVVHVEDGDVDRSLVGRGSVIRPLDPVIAEDPAGGAGRAIRHAELAAVLDLVGAGEGQGSLRFPLDHAQSLRRAVASRNRSRSGPEDFGPEAQGARSLGDRLQPARLEGAEDRKSTRLNSSHPSISYA